MRAADVTVAPVATRIRIDVSARRIVLYRRGREVLRTTVAVGAPLAVIVAPDEFEQYASKEV